MLLAQPVAINLCGDWTSATVDVLLLFVTVLSVVCAFLAYRHQRNRAKKAAACDLAKYYADDIIEKNSFIANVFKLSKLDDYIKWAIPENSIKVFDKKELEKTLKDKDIDIEQFMRKIHAMQPDIILTCWARIFTNLSERKEILESLTSLDDATGVRVIQNESYLTGEFFQELNDMLNQMEWFSMSCRYGLADEKLLYQSLHQTFLSTVWVLYPFICKKNVNNEDKFFTNIIWLYNRWYQRKCEIKGNAEKKRNRYLAKADAVKPKIFSGQGV